MRYRKLGSTGLAVSEIGIGTGDIAGLFVKATRKEMLDAMNAAFELGINYFDTGPDYGKGISEFNLGWALKQIGYRPIVVTKIDLYPNHLGDLRAATLSCFEGSLARLGVEWVDVLLVHNALKPARLPGDEQKKWVPVTVDEMLGPIRGALQEIQSAGKAKYVGFACESADPDCVAQVLETGLFDVVNLSYNAVNPSARSQFHHLPLHKVDLNGILDEVERNKVGCAVIRPLASGALTPLGLDAAGPKRHKYAGGGPSVSPENFAVEVDYARFAAKVAGDLGLSPSEFGYRFILSDPAVSVIVGGYSELSQLREAVEWAERARGNDVREEFARAQREYAVQL